MSLMSVFAPLMRSRAGPLQIPGLTALLLLAGSVSAWPFGGLESFVTQSAARQQSPFQHAES